MPSFPPCLHGTSFREAAAFVYDETGAVLIATDDAAAKGGGGLRIMPLDQVRWKGAGPAGFGAVTAGFLRRPRWLTARRLASSA